MQKLLPLLLPFLLAANAPMPSTTAAAHKPGEFTLAPATLTLPDKRTLDYELGTLYVPENRDIPNSRTIAIGFARFKATTPNPGPPIIYLPGGPGMSYLSSLPNNINHLNRYREAADVIALDQRGFSDHGDMMKYNHTTPDQPLDQPTTHTRESANFLALAKDSIAAFEKNGFDLRGYTVIQCAHDVNDLRKALGYDKISLVGISFGSQWSFAVLRLHPDIVARALISGTEPLNNGYDMPTNILHSIQRAWKAAEKDPTIAPYVPPGGIQAAADDLLKRFDKAPIQVQIKDPKTNQPLTITLGKEDFQRDFLQPAAESPAFILSLYHQHYDAWALKVLQRRRPHPATLRIIGPLIDTSLGVTKDRELQLRSDPATAYLGTWNFHDYLATADLWPTPDVTDDLRKPIKTETPTIFFHGDFDISTPLENSQEIQKFFPNSKLLIIEHGEHSCREPLARTHPKEWSKLIDFLRTGTMPDLPANLPIPAPKFKTPDFPPPQQK